MKVINEWVSNATNQKITNIIPDPVALNDAVLVLVSAIYFKDAWYFSKQNFIIYIIIYKI